MAARDLIDRHDPGHTSAALNVLRAHVTAALLACRAAHHRQKRKT